MNTTYETIVQYVMEHYQTICTSDAMELFEPWNNKVTRMYIQYTDDLELSYILSIAFSYYTYVTLA
jgi:hypothetical protein